MFRRAALVLVVCLVACNGPNAPNDPLATLTSLEVSAESDLDLPAGRRGQLSVRGHFADGTTTDVSSSVTWRTKEPLIARIDGTLTWTALNLGVTTLTAQLGQHFVSADVNVRLPEPERLVVYFEKARLPLSASTTVSALAVFSDGAQLDVTARTTFAANEILTLEGNEVRGAALGVGNIDAEYETLRAHVDIDVVDAVPTELSVSHPSPLSIGLTQELTTNARWSDGTTGSASRSVLWSSSDESIATVDSNGIVRAIGSGTAQVTAQLVT